MIRPKENWKAKVTHIDRGREAATFVPGTDFDALVTTGVIRLDGRIVDLDVELGTGKNRVASRWVAPTNLRGGMGGADEPDRGNGWHRRT